MLPGAFLLLALSSVEWACPECIEGLALSPSTKLGTGLAERALTSQLTIDTRVETP